MTSQAVLLCPKWHSKLPSTAVKVIHANVAWRSTPRFDAGDAMRLQNDNVFAWMACQPGALVGSVKLGCPQVAVAAWLAFTKALHCATSAVAATRSLDDSARVVVGLDWEAR